MYDYYGLNTLSVMNIKKQIFHQIGDPGIKWGLRGLICVNLGVCDTH